MASEDADENVNGGSGTPDGTSPAQGVQRSDADTDASADQPLDPKTAAAVAAAEAAGAANGETVRIDSWIWAVRLIKTRSLGAAACRGGHVHVNGERVKAAYSVRIGDEVRLRNEGRERIVIVKRLIRKRVGAPVAAQCYVDNSPPPPPRGPSPPPVSATAARAAPPSGTAARWSASAASPARPAPPVPRTSAASPDSEGTVDPVDRVPPVDPVDEGVDEARRADPVGRAVPTDRADVPAEPVHSPAAPGRRRVSVPPSAWPADSGHGPRGRPGSGSSGRAGKGTADAPGNRERITAVDRTPAPGRRR